MICFNIRFSPQLRDDRLVLEKRQNTLLLNGETFDPANYNEATPNKWIIGRPEPVENGWAITVILPHGSPAPRSTRYPEPIVVSADGPVELPPYDGPDEEEAEVCASLAAFMSSREDHETTLSKGRIHIPRRLILGKIKENVYFSETASAFERFPQYGAVVAHVIGTVSILELEMLRPAVSQHGSESLLAIRTAYAALGEDKRRRFEYVKRLAVNTGRKRVWETIKWAYDFCKPVYDVRNRFAHHVWGECPALPHALLLADPSDRLTGQAALSQLLGHQPAEEEAQTLIRILTGEGGSKLSDADAKAIFEMVSTRQNNPEKNEAFNMVFGNPLDFRAPAAEVWTANDFRNAALAANIARTHVLRQLQQISQWLNGLRTEDELEPLPKETQKNQKR